MKFFASMIVLLAVASCWAEQPAEEAKRDKRGIYGELGGLYGSPLAYSAPISYSAPLTYPSYSYVASPSYVSAPVRSAYYSAPAYSYGYHGYAPTTKYIASSPYSAGWW